MSNPIILATIEDCAKEFLPNVECFDRDEIQKFAYNVYLAAQLRIMDIVGQTVSFEDFQKIRAQVYTR